ncbi:unnamed protein product [Zymoseptoria tritici ST99CH_3D1]|nr:unnamed protein product [Zymoseptoria tritici ST99CH_3D1]
MPPPSPEESRIRPNFMNGDRPENEIETAATGAEGIIEEPRNSADARTSLLENSGGIAKGTDNGGQPYVFRHRPGYLQSYGSTNSTYAQSDAGSFEARPNLGDRYPTTDDMNRERAGIAESIAESVTDGLLGPSKKRGTTYWLARKAGIKSQWMMYVHYYIPITNWARQYRWSFVKGDFISALTMSSFYIPMALSYASNLSHMPPINGLYAFVFNPFVYAILGTCPQMVVGPEAAGSLLVGSVVSEAIKSGKVRDDDGMKAAQVGGMVTGLAGGIILLAGLLRLGFLDSVLSRPFLRGFISSIGLVIFVNQLVPEMGLDKVAEHSTKAHGSPLDSLIFMSENGDKISKITCAVSFSAVAIILVCRELKRRLQPLPKLGWVVYFPDRFIIVVLSAVCCWFFEWDKKGLDILGDIRAPAGVRVFEPHGILAKDNFKHVNDAFETAFIIALLGFFESCVAAKALGGGTTKTETVRKTKEDGTVEEVEEADGIRGMTVSSNRELVALGIANLIGGTFMAIPAFGGYGRSKVNASTGGKTPMSSIFLSLITVICTLFLLPYFYYIPKGVLSAMITVVSISLLEEAPHDIRFFYKIGGYPELFLMLLIFLTTFFWSLRGGIIVGIIFSLIRLLKHATRPRIQIVGRIPGTRDFDNAEALAQEGQVELVPHCLIVKIPEPLTFANTGSLKDRLKRLEDHGTNYAHPALPSVRGREHNKNVIFDIHGVTSMDFAATQVLVEIVKDYIDRGTMVFFCRVPSRKGKVWELFNRSGIVDLCGGEHNFYRNVEAALRATEKTSTFFDYANQVGGGAGVSDDDASGTVTQQEGSASGSPVPGSSKGRDYGSIEERTTGSR